MQEEFDVIVVGAGNAALAASVSAKENGAARVLVLEKAPREMRGRQHALERRRAALRL